MARVVGCLEPGDSVPVVGEGDSPVSAVDAATWDGRAIALVGRRNGAAEVWDIGRGERIGQRHIPHSDWVSEIAFADTGDGPLLIVAWVDGKLGTLSLDAGQTHFRNNEKESGVTPVCLVERNGQPVCATAHSDLRLVLRLYRRWNRSKKCSEFEKARFTDCDRDPAGGKSTAVRR